MMQFKAFKPSGMEKIARSMGYQGNMQGFQNFLATNPARQQQMDMYTNKAMQMARGGIVKRLAVGGTVTNPEETQAETPVVTGPSEPVEGQPGIGQFSVEQMYTPGVPIGGTTIAASTPMDASQDIAEGTGQLTGDPIDVTPAEAKTTTATAAEQTSANKMEAAQAAPGVGVALQATQAAQTDPNDPRAQITAAQQTTSSVGNLQAAQGNAFLIDNPVQRKLQNGELITGTGVDAAAVSALTAQTQAASAQANPSQQAMVQGQLSDLMQDFDGANPPAWAAGAMRAATAAMAARGLGSSSLAGQAVVQAAMESALPIAQADANTVAKFESQNLSNRQQAAVTNAKNFLQMDMANLSNRQQTELFKAQQRVQSLFTDQAAENAARQFNASSQNQIDQFFANLSTQTSQFNASQANAQSQFNAGQANTVERFNAELNNQRDQFNATNHLVIAQANAQWRRQVATADTAAINRANELNANAILDISKQAYDNLWNYYADTMEWAWKSSENELERVNDMAIAKLNSDSNTDLLKFKEDAATSQGYASLIGSILTAQSGSFLGSILGL